MKGKRENSEEKARYIALKQGERERERERERENQKNRTLATNTFSNSINN